MFSFFYDMLNDPTNLILLTIGIPFFAGIAAWLLKKNYALQFAVTLLAAGFNFILAIALWKNSGLDICVPFAGMGFELHFIADKLSSTFFLLAASSFLFISIYSASYYKEKKHGGLFLLLYFISLSMINGALLADNLIMLLFFWEGLLCTLFCMLLMNNLSNPRTATKALAISGAADLLLMFGIIITVHISSNTNISTTQPIPLTGLAIVGCLCLLLGALGKAGAMPFHSWIPNAASDAPVPFLPAFPGSMEKIIGVYLIVRVITDIYDVPHASGMSTFLCIIGVVTLFFGASMALIQKDMRRLLAYHAISQVGYMILGIGTCLDIGFAGGMFHMINNVLYKSALFMIAGMIEAQIGTTDLHYFSGLGKKMPLTMVCFIICGLSIAGFPGLNGFFSKELIFDAALETHVVYYIFALLGAFMTAASFLKLGGSAFFGKLKLPQNSQEIRDARLGMLIPVILLCVLCLLFSFFNHWPLSMLIQNPLDLSNAFSGWPNSTMLVILSCTILFAAIFNHIYGLKYNKKGALGALDHIHYAPSLKRIYALAEDGKLDPFYWFTGLVNSFSFLCQQIERGISWLYDKGIPAIVKGTGNTLRRLHNGTISIYLTIAIIGAACIAIIFLIVLL